MRNLVAGPLTLEYSEGSLWNVSDGGEEVIRRIYLVFQDINWTSRPFVIKDENWNVTESSFSATIYLQGTHDAKNLSAELSIVGSEKGDISYGFEATTTQKFLRNRLGLCILHPVEGLSGRACTLTTANGLVEESTFPERISPNQPFLDLTGISHQLNSGQMVSVKFDGEIFETEDHRNWSDASYKTYCTPISLPFPALVEPGQTLKQKIFISLLGERTSPVVMDKNLNALITVDAQEIPLPEIGLGLTEDPDQLNESEYIGFDGLEIKHFRLSINEKTQSSSSVEKALKICAAHNVALDLAIAADSPEQVNSILESIVGFHTQIRSFYIFSSVDKTTPQEFIEAAQNRLGQSAVIVGGTDLYFTELNRNQRCVDFVEQINFSINPQVHSFDDRTLIQNTVTQEAIARAAFRISQGQKIRIGPITLRPRYNPNATEPDRDVSNTPLPSSVDARQRTWFTEAWTAMSLRSITQSEAASTVTYFETLGWRGIRELSTGSKDSQNFPSTPGEEFPVWRLLRELKGYTHAWRTSSSLPEWVDCLIVTSGKRRKAIVANFSSIEQEVHFSGVSIHPQVLQPKSVTYLEITEVDNV